MRELRQPLVYGRVGLSRVEGCGIKGFKQRHFIVTEPFQNKGRQFLLNCKILGIIFLEGERTIAMVHLPEYGQILETAAGGEEKI